MYLKKVLEQVFILAVFLVTVISTEHVSAASTLTVGSTIQLGTDNDQPFPQQAILSQAPMIILADPTANLYASYSFGHTTFQVAGKVWDSDGDNVTISATIGGKTQSFTVVSPPTTVPDENNFTLTWSVDAGPESVPVGTYKEIQIIAEDSNGTTQTALYTGKIQVDFTLPTVPMIQFTSPAGYQTGQTSYQPVTFTINGGADEDSGVSHHEYRLRLSLNDWSNWMVLSGPVTISDIGVTEIQAVTVDKAGNQSDWVEGRAYVTNQPIFTFATPGPQIVSNREGNKTFSIKGKVWDIDNDYVSLKTTIGGVTKKITNFHAPTTEPEEENFTLAWDLETDLVADGVYDGVEITVNNGAGKETYPGTIIVDKTAPTEPTLQFTSPAGYTSGRSTTQNVTFTINNGTDATSGVLKSQYRTKENSGDWGVWMDYSAPITISAIGTTQIQAKTIDKAGNESAQIVAEILKTNPPPPPPPDILVTGVSLNESSLTLKVDEPGVRLEATVHPSNATNTLVFWNSSNTGVVTVDQYGNVKPVAAGQAVITVTTASGSYTASCAVKVEEKEKLIGLKVSEEYVLLKPNRSLKFSVYAVYDSGSEKEITFNPKTFYSSSSEIHATVKPGTIKAGKNEGKAIVKVSFEGQSTTIEVTVLKASVKELILSPDTFSLEMEEVKQLNLTAKLSTNETIEVTSDAKWSSEDSSVITVDKGEVTAISPGTATITASYGGKTANLKVEVKEEKKIKRMVVNKRTVTLTEGKQQEISLTVYYQDNSRTVITDKAEWVSSDEQVATVQNGVITAVASGTATIKAKYKGRSVSIKVTVT